MRLGSLCSSKDHAAILSDINNALKYAALSENAKDTQASVLSMKAKLEHDGGDDTHGTYTPVEWPRILALEVHNGAIGLPFLLRAPRFPIIGHTSRSL
jgi:hypothetical protein